MGRHKACPYDVIIVDDQFSDATNGRENRPLSLMLPTFLIDNARFCAIPYNEYSGK
jgi:hypothetical protein